ncbi:hypothetical protein [Metabacillus halosaccharovorans]|uniref:Uncharacterized protein n=1 Tax=Metabacillus halosaccharovorans TaxID=930124 RepID=A0ABT3DCK0_9BACI|nr:hypothetical protein [Metabacillus halosaccharovorans]MCV9884687.1 hypothetical protein [Metabacillus halosaccharovorans]
MYRPTVRYSDTYRDYINSIFRATTLDRNQILRLALHAAAHSTDFQQAISKYKRDDVPLPLPTWNLDSTGFWMENTQQTKERGVRHANLSRDRQTETIVGTTTRTPRPQTTSDRCEQPIKRREGEVPTRTIRVTNQGGIKHVL